MLKMPSSFLSAVLFLLTFHQEGYATRYLPSIVWDHYNPMLSCKSNWFNPVTYLEIYDRFVFVCPTPYMNVALMDDQSRPNDRMNVNMFQRKWTGTLDELKEQMKSGEFCDPNHNDAQKIFTCEGGNHGQGKKMRFARDTGYKKGDIVVWFNNANDGKKSSLGSHDKKCAMALVANITWNVATKYSLIYKKNLDPNCQHCNNLYETCTPTDACPTTAATRATTTTAPTRANTTTTATQSTNATDRTQTGRSSTTTNSTTARISTGEQTKRTITSPSKRSNTTQLSANSSKQKGSTEEWDSFRNGFLAGFFVMLFIAIIMCLIYFFICRPQKKQRKTGDNYKQGSQSKSHDNNNLGSEKQAGAIPKKPPLSETNGINNQGFQPTTLKRGDSPV